MNLSTSRSREPCPIGRPSITDSIEFTSHLRSLVYPAVIKYYCVKHPFILSSRRRVISPRFRSHRRCSLSFSFSLVDREIAAPVSSQTFVMRRAFDRSPISNAVYEFCAVSNRVYSIKIGCSARRDRREFQCAHESPPRYLGTRPT